MNLIKKIPLALLLAALTVAVTIVVTLYVLLAACGYLQIMVEATAVQIGAVWDWTLARLRGRAS